MSNKHPSLAVPVPFLTVAISGVLLGCAVWVGCSTSRPDHGTCAEDSECGAGLTCLFDLTKSTSYCTRVCARDIDCPVTQTCRLGTDTALSGATQTHLCVDRVRTCGTEELCNGLDDDCDGVVDGPGCRPVTGCLDDASCGAFICRAFDGEPDTRCAAASTSTVVADFLPCARDSDCRTGLCETGVCSPLCRPMSAECPTNMLCARAVGPRSRPPHNACQRRCATSSGCPAPEVCVLRDVYQGADVPEASSIHAFVCSLPGPERKPLGATCTAHSLAGDDECAGGLCFNFVCTRPCDPGDACADLGPRFECVPETLRYGGALEITSGICETP